ncbi:MAG: hypothetical protein ABID40_04925 [Candidatus Bipolaricaulota bacterium]
MKRRWQLLWSLIVLWGACIFMLLLTRGTVFRFLAPAVGVMIIVYLVYFSMVLWREPPTGNRPEQGESEHESQ